MAMHAIATWALMRFRMWRLSAPHEGRLRRVEPRLDACSNRTPQRRSNAGLCPTAPSLEPTPPSSGRSGGCLLALELAQRPDRFLALLARRPLEDQDAV